MQNDHSVNGTHVEPNESALIIGSNGDFRLCMPEYGDDEAVPYQVAIISAIWLKLRNDENWAATIVEEAFADD